MEISTGKHKQVSFGVGIALMAVACVALIWYTNPELITNWFKKETLPGKIEWNLGPPPVVTIKNDSDIEWKDVKVTLNKSSVSQRYEFSVPSIRKHPQGLWFRIPAEKFQKSNGEAYDINAGAPHTITVEATLPEDKKGDLEIKLGDKKI